MPIDKAGLMFGDGKVAVVRHKQIEIAITIDVEETSPGAQLVCDRDTVLGSDISKHTVAVVSLEDVRDEIADIEIGQPVIVIIANTHSQGVAGAANTRLLSNVGEMK